MAMTEGKWLNLPSFGLSVRVLFTGYLLAIGLGLLMAGFQIMLTHGMADGKMGLSLDDVVYSYYGNRGNSKLEAKLHGSMKDMAPEAIRADIIAWVRNGASEEEYNESIKGLKDQYCTKCHGTVPGLPEFNSYEQLLQVAETDQGATVSSLTRVSHIHLFGISFIFYVCRVDIQFQCGYRTMGENTGIGDAIRVFDSGCSVLVVNQMVSRSGLANDYWWYWIFPGFNLYVVHLAVSDVDIATQWSTL